MDDVFAIAIHGGAGDESKPETEEEKQKYLNGLREALDAGLRILREGGEALDAVEAAVACLEDNPLFNAGHGAAYGSDGMHYLDAAIMKGEAPGCGSVAGLTTVKNPVRLARLAMEKSPYVTIISDDAEAFADEMGVERVENTAFDDPLRYQQWKKKQEEEKSGGHGTVGAVALDKHGHVAAATSTGGLTNARKGRVSDTAIIGAGTYANNETCAVSCTGTGEQFIRFTVAYDIHAQVAYAGRSIQKAVEEVVLKKLEKGDGGVIVVDNKGNIALVFNTDGMFRGCADSKGRYEVAL